MITAQPQLQPVLEGRGLSKHFASGTGRIQVLNGCDVSIQASTTYSIRGESGSGKSTLLNLLAGIEFADEGSVLWEGDDISRFSVRRVAGLRAAFLGFVFQSFYLIPELNALENVALAGRIAGQPVGAARERAVELLAELGMSARERGYPAQLSGGERQRVAIARALLNRPKIILADEPTGNLDERTSAMVMDLLCEAVQRHGAALVLVTHHAGFAARMQVQMRMHAGALEPVG